MHSLGSRCVLGAVPRGASRDQAEVKATHVGRGFLLGPLPRRCALSKFQKWPANATTALPPRLQARSHTAFSVAPEISPACLI